MMYLEGVGVEASHTVLLCHCVTTYVATGNQCDCALLPSWPATPATR